MKLPRALLVVVSASSFVVSSARAVERLPLEDFTREPDTSQARLSPDGKHVAYLRDVGGKTKLHVLDLDSRNTTRIDPGTAVLVNGARKEVSNFEWVSDTRVVVSTSVWDSFYGVVATDIDGRRAQPISGLEDERINISASPRLYLRETIHRFYDKDQSILMLDRHEAAPGSVDRPDVMKVGTTDGFVSVEVKNPGDVAGWAVDSQGVVRLGIVTREGLTGAIYRDGAKEPWREILPPQQREGGLHPIGFDAANNRVFVTALTPEKRWALFQLDPATGLIGDALLTDTEYDILPPRFTPRVDGLALCAPLFSRDRDALLGVRYVTDAPRVKWFDRAYAGYQKAVDRVSPETVNLLVDESRDGKRKLWFGYSDQNPGVYLLLDVEKRAITPVLRRMGWIKPKQMAPMLAVKYGARDGLVIHGFLTVPVGHEPKGLPLVVRPHGGPWVRDVWGYNPLVQLLANRGYAVLQMNYRGSPGYGEELVRSARKQVGGKIQDDIEDATRWAIASGIADPKRIAIAGGSYGGYSALFALGHTPELYRCGVSFAGVTDWVEIFDDRKSDPAYKAANRHWRREMGDPEKDREFFRSISPVNLADKIVAPVLILQGKDDHVVPAEQAKLMIAALKKAGREPRSVFIAKQGHNYASVEGRTEIFKHIVAFLEQQLGPGVQ